MRERRRVEVQNREQVGFLGTVFGKRAVKTAKPTRREVEEYKVTDERQDTDKPEVDNTTGKAEASGAPSTTTPDHEKALASEAEPTSSAGDHVSGDHGKVSNEKSPALSITNNASSSEQPAHLSVAEETPADVGLDSGIQLRNNPDTEPGK